MDTISRENNSILPIAGVLVGVLALLLSGVALVKLSSANTAINGLKESVAKLDTVENEARSAQSAAEQAKTAADTANRNIGSLQSSTQTAFQSVATELGNVRAELEKMRTPVKAAKGGEKGEKGEKAPVVAGEGEYIVKKGDYGAKIAKDHGVSLADLKAVNPSVDLAKVQIGQKIKLPKK